MQAEQYKLPVPGEPVMAGPGGQREWRLALFVLALVPLLVGLGFWQLSRAEEKAALAADYAAKRTLAPLGADALQGLAAAELAYLPVALTGRFHPERYFLLDNRTRQGRFGNEVIALFFPAAGGPGFLVNRGWVPADPARRAAPQVPPVPSEVTVLGHVYVPPGETFVLGDQQPGGGWPVRVQSADMALLREVLDMTPGELFPYVVRLSEDSPAALRTGWPVVNVSASKHTGYAVQWFAMAAVLTLIYLWHRRQRADGREAGP